MCGYNSSGAIPITYDPSPPGVSLSPGSETYVDPCPCVDSHVCPWCGSELAGMMDDYTENSDLHCPDESCKWTWRGALDAINEPPDYPEP